MLNKVYLVIALWLGTFMFYGSVLVAQDISGVWQHSAKPVLLNVDLASGLVKVKSHKNNKDSEGLTVIKNINKNAQHPQYWFGEMYNGYIQSYVPVELYLASTGTLLVHDAKGLEVLKLYRQK